MKFITAALLFASTLACSSVFSQQAAAGPEIIVSTQKNGTIKGLVTEQESGDPIASASIQIYQDVLDTTSHKVRQLLVGSMISKTDGTFELANLPTPSKLKLVVAVVGHETYQKVFSLTTDGSVQDMGTLKLVSSTSNLKDVTVNATSDQFFKMGVDRKIFSVAQSLVSTGQTAAEVMAQIPSVDVDMDGNVSLRGGSPQLFIDGKPTTLTLDQIPSDIIDKVELITNPSAKFDASSNGGSIINIVLKKDRKSGYNGGLTAGVDTRGATNFGGDFAFRQGKFNFFARGMHRGRDSKSENSTRRNFLNNDTSIVQTGTSHNTGSFGFYNAGIDYLMNGRNTITLEGRYVRGTFDQDQPTFVDSLAGGDAYSYSRLASSSGFHFKDLNGELSYKHLFNEDGDHNLTFDARYSNSDNGNNSDLNTGIYNDPQFTDPRIPNILRTTYGDGKRKRYTVQADYVNPISEDNKIEAGLRFDSQNSDNSNYQYEDSTGGLDGMKLNTRVSSLYSYDEKTYAAYGIWSSRLSEKFTYQLGLRAERYEYSGKNYSIDGKTYTPFAVNYPLNLFPSAFLTYTITDKQDLQASYSRKTNRPNFWQLIPVYDYSDPYNIRVGNSSLKPEFTNLFELNYNIRYGANSNFLVSGYMRQTMDMITRYQYIDSKVDPSNDSTIVNSYINANTSYTYGLELTDKMTLLKIWDLTGNINIFNSIINTRDLDGSNIRNQQWSWFAKLNNTFKLPKGFSFQWSGDYHAKTVLPNGTDNRRGGFGGSNLGTAQGYISPYYGFDAAIKKDWKWGEGNSLSLTASINDIFGTEKRDSYSKTAITEEYSSRFRTPRIVRLTLSWRFGQIDKSLFKRKAQPDQGSDNGGGNMGGQGGDMGGM
ncbi:Outer membrane receptor proteins, mostly Fe transport [Arachidicoccus rhizosphaerae]|uniref:Outer membrane receptor proteins, mostly Fe transport n=1 Tax=Arachidicoccus rhizosphaerae TaxID=551991 RepID=A0A1H4C3M7_9BACT|nr:outer membrane beta-barrel family protein [Arachidicoccus rhizosphaerae]SEA54937.1 Outer membrane receptor proteins, mostly Fe transport [Arachidicoccus rhizosphaerae]